MKINKMITPYKKTTMNNKKNKYIVIHYVGGVSSAKNNCIYYNRKDARDASAHYFVDDTGVYQLVEDKDAAWHCGATSYKHKECRNSNSIGIEMCLKKDGAGKLYVTESTIEIVGQLVRELMDKYNIDKTHIIRHFDVTGKLCPNCNGLLNDATWIKFRDRISKNTTIKPAPTPTPKPSPAPKPSINNKVRDLQIAINKDLKSKLVIDGIMGPKTMQEMKKIVIKAPKTGSFKIYPNITSFIQKQVGVTIDGLYGKNTMNAVKTFQKNKQITQDGIVGYNTLMKLVS
ncbi:MAG: N-acetylmuramoyl-L-alanine amidase [Coprobacillus sp.]